MGYFRHRSNPEAVLKKATGTVKLGDKEDAWNIISEYLASRNKKGWRAAVNEMMSLFVDLCVELRKSPKDGFIQYRHHCSQLHLDSLEQNLRELIEKATTRGNEEHDELLEQFEGQDLQDPEVRKKYTKAQFQLPSLKFQWTTYRVVLDVLRNNQKLDPLYQETVRGAIRYCTTYNRTSEYRKLCDVCRKHLRWIFDHQTPGKNFVEIGTQNMLSIYLNTRFLLLENATKLQLWQEAYRLITDIYELRQKSTIPLEPSLEKNYYNKLAQIFIGSNNVVLHAYAVIRYFVLLRDEWERQESGLQVRRKKDEEPLTEDQIKKIAMKCILATCATPPPRCLSDTIGPAMNSEDDKFRLMCDKLHFHSRPNQKNLCDQLEKEEISDGLPQVFSEIQKVMMSDNSPLTLCSEVMRVMNQIIEANEDLAVYMEPMKQACARKLIVSVSKMYKSIPMDRLLKMITFDDWSRPDVESLLLDLTRKKVIWCSMSHKFGMCSFRPPPRIQRSAFMRTYFADVASKMKSQMEKEENVAEGKNRGEFFEKIREFLKNDDKTITQRAEKNTQKRARSDYTQRFRKWVKKTDENQKKAKENNVKRTQKQQMLAEKEKRLKAIQEQMKRDKAAEEARLKAKKQLKIVSKVVKGKVKTKTKVGTKKLKKILNNDDPEVSKAAIDTWTVDYLESIKAAQEAQAQEYLTHNDYFVRACRKEEIPLIRKQNAEIANNSSTDQMEEYKKVWAKLKEEHDEKLKVKSLASRVRAHTEYFAKHLEERRERHYQAAKAIQLERKANHDFKRAEQKRKIQEKRAAQVERNRAAKEAEAARLQQFKQAEEAKEEKKVDPEPEPTRADAGNLGAPRLDTRARFSQDQPPERTPIGPPKREMSGPGPARRNPDGTPIGAKPAAAGVDTDNWRVAGKDGKPKRGRPKFTNSKKKEPVKKEETPASSPTASSGSSTPKSLRPERPKDLQPMRQTPASQPLRPQRPLRPTRSPTENSARQNLRSTRSPTENSTRQSLRPTRPPNPSLRPENPAFSRPSNPTPGFRARTSANPRQRTGIMPSQKKGGWRERQQMREVGIVDPVATIRQRDSPRKSPRAATGFNRDSSSIRPNRTQNSGTVRPIRPQAPGAKPGLRPPAPGSRGVRPQARGLRPPASETRSVRPNSVRPPSRPPSGNLQPTPIQTQRQPEKQNNDASPEFQTVTRRRRKRFTNSRKS